MELDRTERRVIGCLIEKRWATPDQYPLSLKTLVAACNQRNNRAPVLDLQSFEVEGALLALREKRLVLVREREGGRVVRYAERFTLEFSLEPPAAAVLAELMLRGPQTPPELARRTKRMAEIGTLEEAEEVLGDLSRRHLARLLPRPPGRKLARWTHLLLPEAEVPTEPEEPEPTRRASVPTLREEIAALKDEVAELRDRVARLEP